MGSGKRNRIIIIITRIQMNKSNVLIIGSGNRVQKTILPALCCLPNKYNIVGICSRTEKNLILPGGKRTIRTIIDMDTIDLRHVDIIIIAVTTEIIPEVIHSLTRQSVHHIVLFLDTPVLYMKHIHTARLFSLFRNVYVTEDYIAMPITDVVKRIVQTGVIGKLKQIYLFHSGYKYHALAFLRRILSEQSISTMIKKALSGAISEIHIRFPGGIRATIVEPKDYAAGRLLVIGEKGFISDYPLSGERAINIAYTFKNGIYGGMNISGEVVEKHRITNPLYWSIIRDLLDTSLINCIKIEGLIRLFESLSDQPFTYAYSYEEGLYDSAASAILDAYGFFIDARPPFVHESIMRKIIGIMKHVSSLM